MIHYYNYKKGIKPSYLKPFEMMSDLVSPKSVSLVEKEKAFKIIRISRILLKLCDCLVRKVMLVAALIVHSLCFIN